MVMLIDDNYNDNDNDVDDNEDQATRGENAREVEDIVYCRSLIIMMVVVMMMMIFLMAKIKPREERTRER